MAYERVHNYLPIFTRHFVIVLAILSVCPTIRHIMVLYLNDCTYRHGL